MTIILALIHATSSNKDFNPTILYILTAFIDIGLVDAFVRL